MLWAVLVLYGIYEHIFWRDEVRALSIAIASDGFFGLPHILENEGHPILWYVFLKTGYLMSKQTWILPLFSFCFAAGFSYLLLFKSRFPLWVSAALIFGVFGLYDFSIMARNYGIAAFFFLLFAHFARLKKPLWALGMLILAAQTNSYATVFSLFLGTAYFVFELKKSKKEIALFLLLIFGVVFAYFIAKPNASSVVVGSIDIGNIPLDKIWTLGYGFLPLLKGLEPYLGKINLFWSSALLYASLLLFIRKPWVMLLALAGMVFMTAFQLGIRANFLRHCGIFVFYFTAIAWWQLDTIKATLKAGNKFRIPLFIALLAIAYMLADQLAYAKFYYSSNIYNKASNAKYLGQWLTKNAPENAVIISEPDYIMESVVYYYNKSFYLPRERRSNTYSHFTKANKNTLHIKEILAIADSFKQLDKTVYFNTNWDFKDSVFKDTLTFSYDKRFFSSLNSRNEFREKFKLIQSFNQWIWTDEVYYLYQYE